jgi:hypothetical protein
LFSSLQRGVLDAGFAKVDASRFGEVPFAVWKGRVLEKVVENAPAFACSPHGLAGNFD